VAVGHLLLLDSRHFAGDFGLLLFQFLLELDEKFNTIDNHLDQFNFRETNTIGVGDIEGSVSGGSEI